MNAYKVLSKQFFTLGKYSLAPIRIEDRYKIMQWRNEQMYHLRQSKLLTEEDQDIYFNTVVADLFKQERPNQILFSYLEGDTCIGYGGLVHINWMDKNAEISFIINTQLEEQFFEIHWGIYLKLIEEVGFSQLKLHKLYVYAFDLRPKLYLVLDSKGYFKDAVLTEHCYFQNSFINVVIYSKLNQS